MTHPVTSVITRPMTLLDIPQVHRIEKAVSPDPWSADLLAAELDGNVSDRHWLVADTNGEIVGFGGLFFVVDEAHIMNLAVDPLLQRQGLATRLVAELLAYAADRGATDATLEVRASNTAALGLYKGFRFEEAGRRPRYYPNGEDAVIMWAHKIFRREYVDLLTDKRHRSDRGGPSC